MRLSYLFRWLVLGIFAVLAVTGCGGSAADGSTASQAADAEAAAVFSASEAMGFVPSSKAGEHMGEDVTVRGSVRDYQWISGKTGKPTLLLFDTPALVERGSSVSEQEIPTTFTVVVWRKDAKNFPGTTNLGPTYNGKTVCVTGLIEDYEGSPAIIATDGSQLEIDC